MIVILFHWLLPNFNSMDNIGSQWFYLSVINFIVLTYNLIFQKSIDSFFKLDKWLLAPIILFFWGFTGIFNAVNTSEVIIESARYLNVFITFFNIYFLIKSIQSLNFIIGVILFFLVYEVSILFPKFYQSYLENGFIRREQVGAGIAANINIATYSILLKLPFLFYAHLKSENKFIRNLLLLISFFSFLVISIFATRSAIICIILLLTIIGFIFLFKKRFFYLKKLFLILAVPFLISIGINKVIQRKTSLNTIERLISITESNDKSTSNRLKYYTEALTEFFEEPLFGVGIGNFKIHSIRAILDSERFYIVPYHTHNDFLQILAELSIIGLFLYLVFIYGGSILIILRKNFSFLNIIFLTSLFIYSFDASFNFPHARPVIQVFLALLLALILHYNEKKNSFKMNFKPVFILLFFFLAGSIYINKRVFDSLIEQNILAHDYRRGIYDRDPETIKTFEEDFPNLNTSTLPIKALKANYYSISDPKAALKKIDEAINDNPVIMFPQVLKSLVYMKQLKIDSAYYYSRLAFDKGPTIDFHAITFLNYVGFLNKEEDLNYVKNKISKSNSDIIWTKYINTLYELKKNNLKKEDKELLNFLVDKFPSNKYFKNLNSSKELTFDELKIIDSIGKKADSLFQLKNYEKALGLYSMANELHPGEPAYVQNIAVSYFRNGDYDNCKIFLDKLYDEYGVDNGFKEYYLGSIEVKQGTGNGCDYFFKSYDKGFKSGEIMYKNFCLNKN